MKNLTFGIEIELTGISREAAAKAVAGYFGTSAHYLGGGYDKWEAPDNQGRSWFIMNDQHQPETKRQAENSGRAGSPAGLVSHLHLQRHRNSTGSYQGFKKSRQFL